MKLLLPALIVMLLPVFSANAAPSYDEFIEEKQLHQGFFSFYTDKKSGKVYLEVPIQGEQFLLQTSMPHGLGSNDIGLDRGQLGDTRLVQFEQTGEKVFLRQLNTYYRANSTNELEKKAVKQAFASSIIWGFKVSASSENGSKVLIDYTPFLLSDVHNMAATLKNTKQGSFNIDKSRSGFYAQRSKAFPDNTELEATITFTGKDAGNYLRSVSPDNTAITVNFHHSLIALPDNNYQTRAFHPLSGFWANSFADYATDIDKPLIQRNIPRHRLQKKDQTAEISEAVEPIIYYLDAGVPEPIRSALLDGARWWDQAFSAIGYKNAFQVKMLPADADPMDVRYNVIQWVHRATRGWSYGASVIDPRTGEIIKGHVTLGSLRVRQDYLIALGLTSPFKTKQTDTSAMKEMALARIRQLSAHEVGHTLGIAHNFAASSNQRASVMDYPHPLITLNKGKINLDNAYASGIGLWDKSVIAYGYGDVLAADESKYLANVIKRAQKQGLDYISDPDARAKSSGHASAHLWDNGENAAEELLRVLKVRKVALAQFGLTSIPIGAPLSELEPVLVPVYNFHRFQVEAAAKLIAGVDYTYQVRELNVGAELQAVNGKLQQQALSALMATLTMETLTLPAHISQLIPPKAYGYQRDRESFSSNTGVTFDAISAAQASINNTLSLLLNGQRLARLEQQAVLDPDIPSVSELLNLLVENSIKLKGYQGSALLVQQRLNQQVVEHLLSLWHHKHTVTEVRAPVYVVLKTLESWLKENAQEMNNKALSAQFSLLQAQISYSLSQGKLFTPASEINLPPGSPIG
jgi:hypothetical protein